MSIMSVILKNGGEKEEKLGNGNFEEDEEDEDELEFDLWDGQFQLSGEGEVFGLGKGCVSGTSGTASSTSGGDRWRAVAAKAIKNARNKQRMWVLGRHSTGGGG